MNKKIYLVIFGCLLLLHLFFRFYQLEERASFNWDQIDNAWKAKDILLDKNYPLVGMQAKLNSGFYIGPFYYYLISIVYFFTGLDPVASPIMAGITSLFTFTVIYLVLKNIFNQKVALLGIFLYVTSILSINSDRVQWPVNFITLISFLIFYFLYQVINGREKFIIPLSIATALSFHVHFTAIFYPLIILLTLPFFPNRKILIKYLTIQVIAFLIILAPLVLYLFRQNTAQTSHYLEYYNTYSHGFHLRRLFQLSHDAFIEFEAILGIKILRNLVFLYLPIFILIFLKKQIIRQRIILCYLSVLWFLIPWFIFTLYSGEISDYYFRSTRPIAIMVLAYILYRFWQLKTSFPKIIVSCFLFYFLVLNFDKFSKQNQGDLPKIRENVTWAIENNKKIEFQEGIGESYLYFIKTRK